MGQLFAIDAYCAFNQFTSRVPLALSADGHKLAFTLQCGKLMGIACSGWTVGKARATSPGIGMCPCTC